MALDLFTPYGFFHHSLTKFSIINSYSTKGPSNNTRTVPPNLIFPVVSHPTLMLGDLNLHHPTLDPLRGFTEDELATSGPSFHRATELGFSLINPPGMYTWFPMSHVGRPGVLDLAFPCPLRVPYFSEWCDLLHSTGSDNIPSLISLHAPLFRYAPPSPNWALTA